MSVDDIVVVDGGLHPVHFYLASVNESSRITIDRGLRRVADIICHHEDIYNVPWQQLTPDHFVMIKDQLQRVYKPATANNYLSAVRGLIRSLWRQGLIDTDRYQRIVDIGNIKFHTEPAGRAVKSLEVRSLLLKCLEDGIIGIRDAAVITTFYVCGMRRDELSYLKMENYKDNVLHIRHGKGRKERNVDVANPKAIELLDTWLNLRGDVPGYLFPKMGKGNRIFHEERFTGFAIHAMIKRRVAQAGIEDMSTHDLRRTLITNLLDAGVDVITASYIAGHGSTDTTKRCDRRPAEARKKALSKLDLPI